MKAIKITIAILATVAFIAAVGVVGSFDQDEYIEVNSTKVSKLTRGN